MSESDRCQPRSRKHCIRDVSGSLGCRGILPIDDGQTALQRHKRMVNDTTGVSMDWGDVALHADPRHGRGMFVKSLLGYTAAQVTSYVKAYDAIRDQWWDKKSKNRHTRLKLHSKIFKRLVIDSFCVDLYRDALLKSGPDVKIVVIYGTAIFSPSGKGNLIVPTTGIYKAFRRAFQVVEMQEEFRTTLNCHKCHIMTENVWERCAATLHVYGESVKLTLEGILEHEMKVPKAYRKFRGLRFCPKCAEVLNSDMNRSINIGNVWRSVHVEGQGVPKAFDRKHCIAMTKRKH